MDKDLYKRLEQYMLSSMKDSAHDKEHIRRVLYLALDIAESEENVNTDVLIASCLLHDIGREKQYTNKELCHAHVGAVMAYDFCKEQGFSEDEAQQIKHCISAHRFRSDNPPKTIEAKILFDADKLDVTGVIGISRTLFHGAREDEPLYIADEEGKIIQGDGKEGSSFLHEYNYKLKNIYDIFYTERGKEMAMSRRSSACTFYESMLSELESTYKNGFNSLTKALS